MANEMRYADEYEVDIFSINDGDNTYTFTFNKSYSSVPIVKLVGDIKDVSMDINKTRVILTYPDTKGVTNRELVVLYKPKISY